MTERNGHTVHPRILSRHAGFWQPLRTWWCGTMPPAAQTGLGTRSGPSWPQEQRPSASGARVEQEVSACAQ